MSLWACMILWVFGCVMTNGCHLGIWVSLGYLGVFAKWLSLGPESGYMFYVSGLFLFEVGCLLGTRVSASLC